MFVKCKIKEYPDGNMKAYVYKEPYIKGVDRGDNIGKPKDKSGMTAEEIEKEEVHQKFQNLRRTKNNITDYVLSNDFDLFVTLTFKDYRDSDEICFNRLDNWLRYMRKKHGKFRYVLIPERHKDGCLHFHGVFGGYAGNLTDSGVLFKKQKVFNIDSWNYGFTNCTKIENKTKTASYITKYITKNLYNTVEEGKKKYWHSHGLRKPVEHHFEENPFANDKPSFSNDFIEIYDFLENNNKKN